MSSGALYPGGGTLLLLVFSAAAQCVPILALYASWHRYIAHRHSQ